MKTVTRHGVFETNSSSTHSISWNTTTPTNISINVVNSKVQTSCTDFGWEEASYNDFATKLSYLITWLVNEGLFEEECIEYHNLFDAMYRANPLFRGFDLDDSDLGYIDHQSSDVAKEALSSTENITNFLFNPGTYLVTDNDNH